MRLIALIIVLVALALESSAIRAEDIQIKKLAGRRALRRR